MSCHPNGFISLRRAKRAAWWHSTNTADGHEAKTVAPVRCEDCERWFLAAVDQKGLTR